MRPPNSTSPCPSEPCHVLNYYTQHHTFNTSNARFVFLPGNHTLNTTIVVKNVQNLTLTGDDRFETGLLGPPAPSSQIHCNRINGTGFDFENTFTLSIKKLLLLECVHKKDRTELLPVLFGALTMQNTFNSTISMVTIQQSPGSGIVAVNLFGSITESIFLFSNDTLAHFEYNNDYSCLWHKGDNNALVIDMSKFLNGYGSIGTLGLTFMIEKTCPGIRIMLENVTVVGSNGFYAGHVYIIYTPITPTSPSITFTNSHFLNGHSLMEASGGVTALFIQDVPLSTLTFNTYYPLTFKYCKFQSNSAVYGSAVLIIYWSESDIDMKIAPFHLALLENCIFSDSESPPAAYKSVLHSVTYLINSNVTFFNCTFEDNIGTAIIVANSIITFEGINTFRNNSGTDGGALLFSTNSYMFLQENTHIYFINNHAEYGGGAIYVHNGDCFNVFPCFFQLAVSNHVSLKV